MSQDGQQEVRKAQPNASGSATAPARSQSEPSQAPRGSFAESSFLADGGEALRRIGRQAREEMKKPTVGAALVGAAVVGSAVLLGIAETAIGAAAAYVVYRMLKRRSRT
jgi:hypothetical protein